MSGRVTVIGAGIIGLSSAWYLQQAGFSVTVIDRDGPDRNTTSYGNAGMIVPSHFVPLAAPGAIQQGLKWMWNPRSPFYIKPRLSSDLASWAWHFWRASTPGHVQRCAPLLLQLNRASHEAYRELARSLNGSFDLAEHGLLMLCHTEEGLAQEAAASEQAAALGLAANVLDPQGVRNLEPDFELSVAGAVHYPDDAHLDPGKLMQLLQQQLEAAGTEFHWNAPVTGVSHTSGRISAVRTIGGEIATDEVVLAAGIWSTGLARELDLRLPMQAGKGYSMTLKDVARNLRHPALLAEARVAVTPLGNALRIGGTMELAGISPGVNSRRIEGIINSALRYFPSLTEEAFKDIPVWHGFRPCSPDGLPYLGRPARYRNLVVTTGHSMMGISLGPVSGRLVAGLIMDEASDVDLAALHPDRYNA